MFLKCIATGSKGNSYILTDESGESLILDCGVKSKDIKQALNFDFSKVSGVLVTHEHRDHSLSADEFELYGLPVFRPYLTEGGMDRKTLGVYAVSSFPVEHDGEPCCGFFIRHTNGFRMVYVTDLSFCKFVFKKQELNAILCECNYSDDYLDREQAQFEHKVRGHMGLKACKDFIKVNATDKLKTVVICHMSYYTLDVNQAVKEISAIVPDAKVFYAEKGKEIEL